MDITNPIYWFLRHGNAVADYPGGERQITDLGWHQVQQRLDQILADRLEFDLAVCSDMSRAVNTARGVLVGRSVPLIAIPALGESDAVEAGETDLYQILKTTTDRTPRRLLEEHRAACEKFAAEAWMEMDEVVQEQGAKRILVVGHSPLLQIVAACRFFSKLASMYDASGVKDLDLQECGMFRLSTEPLFFYPNVT